MFLCQVTNLEITDRTKRIRRNGLILKKVGFNVVVSRLSVAEEKV